MVSVHKDIKHYNNKLAGEEKEICELLAFEISKNLPESECKVWHAHPVWFLEGNPIVGYSKQKPGIRLMFWSGKDFGENDLNVVGKKFKDASVFFNYLTEVNSEDLRRWLEKSRQIQWDYKNLIKKKKGVLERIN